MLTNIIKWTAIAALVGGALLPSGPDFPLEFRFVVMVASIVVLVQAATMHRYVWMSLFLVIAWVFNPVLPVLFSSYIFSIAITGSLFLFFLSLELLKPEPAPLLEAPPPKRELEGDHYEPRSAA